MFPRKGVILYYSIAILLLTALAGCGGVNGPSQNRTETFTGTVNVGSAGPAHPFNVSKTGEYSIKVTNLIPTVPSNTQFEVIFGQSISGQCAPITPSITIVNGPALVGPIYTTGSYCAVVVDIGGFTVPEAYTMTVGHP